MGGLRGGATGLRPASRDSFHRFPRSANREDEREPDETEDRGAAEGREHPPLGELDARVAPGFQHGDAVDQITERKQPARGERDVERRAGAVPGNHARHERAREEDDEADALGVRVEEGQARLDGEDGAVADLIVVLRRAREAVRLWVRRYAGCDVALDLRLEPGHGRTAGLAE